MIRIVVLVTLASLLASCGSSTKTFGPDGREAYSLTCSGLARNWGMCLEKAGEICEKRGYDVITATGDQGAVVNFDQSGEFASTTRTRNMVIACK